MTMLEHDLIGMQRQSAELLPDSCVIHVLTTGSDGGGGQEPTWTPGAPVACRIAPVGGGESGETGDRIDARTTHVLTLPEGTEVASKDRIVHDGSTYEATAVRTRTWEVVRRVELREAP